MLDDVVESFARGVLRFLFWILVEVFLFYTGEIILSLLTLGKKKPRWDYYAEVGGGKWVIFTEVSTYIGFAAWLFIFGYIFHKFAGE